MKIINNIHKYKKPTASWYQRPVKNITRLTVHHDAIPNNGRLTDEEVLTNIMREHVSRGYPGASYHFWISKKGAIYQLNNYSDITYHDSVNRDSLGICLNGYFHPNYNEKPTTAQLQAMKFLLDELCTKHPEFPADFDDVRGHRERSATACPGQYLYPYVVEYRSKNGQVSWGVTEVKPVVISLDINADIPSDVETKLGLQDYSWYMDSDLKRGSMLDLMKYVDGLH